MTTTRAVLLATALVATAAGGAHAGGKTITPRRETQTKAYVLPLYQTNQVVLGVVNIGGAQFKPPAWARYVTAVVTDDSGATMAFDISEWSASGHRDRGAYCGRTPGWVPISPVATTSVTLGQGPCPDGSVHGLGTKGTVSATYSDVR